MRKSLMRSMNLWKERQLDKARNFGTERGALQQVWVALEKALPSFEACRWLWKKLFPVLSECKRVALEKAFPNFEVESGFGKSFPNCLTTWQC